MKKCIAIISLLAMLTAAASCSKDTFGRLSYRTGDTLTYVSDFDSSGAKKAYVYEKKIIHVTSRLREIRYPFYDTTASDHAHILNAAIDSTLRMFKDSCAPPANITSDTFSITSAARAEELRSPSRKLNEMFIEAEPMYEDERILVIPVRLYCFRGGNSHHRAFRILNYDKRYKRFLNLDDLFRPGMYHLNSLSKYCAREMGIDLNQTGKWPYTGVAPTSDNYRHFEYTKDHLIIHFAEGQAGSYSMGTPAIEIPKSEIKAALKVYWR